MACPQPRPHPQPHRRPPSSSLHFFVTLAVCFICVSVIEATVPVSSAYLPVRRSYHTNRRSPAHSSAVVPLSYDFTAASDDKRTIAKRLLRNAASHRRNSLRDVLRHTSPQSSSSSSSRPSLDTLRNNTRGSASSSFRRRQFISAHPHAPSTKTERDDAARAEPVKKLHAASHHLFADEHNSTKRKFQKPPISLHVNIDPITTKSTTRTTTGEQRQQQKQQQQQQQRSSSFTSSPPSTAEKKLLLRSIAALKSNSPATATAALRTVEELCHSIHNGQALQQRPGGFGPILTALTSRHRRVRASAAWAIATCCQNNRPVQQELLDAGAVTMLARLAMEDVLTVRARALFALNALVGMEEARLAFEKLPFATQVVMAALKDTRDYRATRRALNLAELLVRKNLDAWKTQLEAWDVPVIIEKLLRHHPNIDVRESAARIISALDGN